MKKFNQFINESNQLVKINKDSVSKKSANKYHKFENIVHEMMNKKPDLFCKFYKLTNKEVSVETLDTKKWIKDIKFAFELEDSKIKDLYFKESGDIDDEITFNGELNFYLKDVKTDLVKDYIKLMFNIYKYFEDFIEDCNIDFEEETPIYTDFHINNFGYKIGTSEIRCFDPLYVFKK